MKGLACIIQFFIYINETKVVIKVCNLLNNEELTVNLNTKIDPVQLDGIEVLWKIVLEANDEDVMEKSRRFLSGLYNQSTSNAACWNLFIDTFLSRVAKIVSDQTEIKKEMLKRMIKLIENIIEESEKNGTGSIKSYNSLIRSSIMSLIIKNDINTDKGIPERIELELYENTSIWDFKVELGKYLQVSPRLIKLSTSFCDINDTNNGKSIGDCIQEKPATIFVTRKTSLKTPLLNKDNSLNESLKQCLTEIFFKFATLRKLNAEGIANFIRATTNAKSINADDVQVQGLLAEFDKDMDQCLDIEDFLELYKSVLMNGDEESVRTDLRAHGFDDGLKKIEETVEVDSLSLPRYLLASNEKLFELLFEMIDMWGLKAEYIWDLINNLAVNPKIYKQIENLTDTVDWNNLFNTKSSFRLLYCLKIIKAFADDDKSTEWRHKFVEAGGFNYLTNLLISRSNSTDFNIDKIETMALKCIESILISFLKSVACIINKDIVTALLEYNKQSIVEKSSEADDTFLKSIPSEIFFPKNSHSMQDIPHFVFNEKQVSVIVNDITSKEIWKRGFDILAGMLKLKTDLNMKSIELIVSSLILLCSCIHCDPSIFSSLKLYEHQGFKFDTLLLFGMLQMDSALIRGAFGNNFRFLCCLYKDSPKADKLFSYMLKLLIGAIPQGSTDTAKGAEFFYFLCKLIDIYYTDSEINKERVFDPKELAEKVLTALKANTFLEGESTEILLIGFMATIKKIITCESALKEFVVFKQEGFQELFSKCLFPTKANFNLQKCKTKRSRTIMYKLLVALCSNSATILTELFSTHLIPLLNSIETHKMWNYAPESEGRSKYDKVGIKNLGCICYMNSILQQLYMIPTFRYGILSVKKYCVNESEDFLYQLQRLFAFLEASKRQYYNPKDFCNSLKDFDNNPINVLVQQDVHEFLNTAFGLIENSLSETPHKFLVRSIFGGKTCNQLICKSCGSVRNKYEDFYDLSLEVKELNSLSESLNKFISDDTISGYFCETCQTKVDVIKRTSISKLPNVMLIHLQRTVFNFDVNANIKINSRLEFPKELSIEPYTLEAREDTKVKRATDDYRYRLAGVVVNKGVADASHYYSLINTNRKSILNSIYI